MPRRNAQGFGAYLVLQVPGILLGGERWRAESLRPHEVIAPGTAVIVRAARGLTLVVEAEGSVAARKGREVSHEGGVGQPGVAGL